MKLIRLTQLDGTHIYLNPAYIIRIKSPNEGGSEILVNGNPVTIFTTETPEEIITLINQ